MSFPLLLVMACAPTPTGTLDVKTGRLLLGEHELHLNRTADPAREALLVRHLGLSDTTLWGELTLFDEERRIQYYEAVVSGDAVRVDRVRVVGTKTRRVPVASGPADALVPSRDWPGAARLRPADPREVPPPDDALVHFKPGAYGSRPPLNAESESRENAWVRADLSAVLKAVRGGNHPVMFGDMSRQDGGTPRLANGNLAHPVGSHEAGRDVDVAYPQLAWMPDSDLRSVCDHVEDGVDQHHCLAPPHRLDVPATARLLSDIARWPNLRCIAVDARIAEVLEPALEGLDPQPPLCVESRDSGAGWFHDHHHHFHVAGRHPIP